MSVTYSDAGVTASVTFQTIRVRLLSMGEIFIKRLTWRAPGRISLKSGLYNIEKMTWCSTILVPTIFHANTPSPKGSTLGPLTCFAVKPDGVRFETQEEGETVILFLRQHIVVNVPWIIMAVIMIFAPTVLFPLFFRMIRLLCDDTCGIYCRRLYFLVRRDVWIYIGEIFRVVF